MKNKFIIVICIIIIVYLLVKNNNIDTFISSTYEILDFDSCPNYIAKKKLANGTTKFYMFFNNKHFEENINPLIFNSIEEVENKLNELQCNKNIDSIVDSNYSKKIVNIFDFSNDKKNKNKDLKITINEECNKYITKQQYELQNLIFNISVYKDDINNNNNAIGGNDNSNTETKNKFDNNTLLFSEIKEEDLVSIYNFLKIYKENKRELTTEINFEDTVQEIIDEDELDNLSLINIYHDLLENGEIQINTLKYESFKNNIVQFGKLKILRFLMNFKGYLNEEKKIEYDYKACVNYKIKDEIEKNNNLVL